MIYSLSNEFLTVEFNEEGAITHLENNTNKYGNIIDTVEEAFRINLQQGENWEVFSTGSKQKMTVTQSPNRLSFHCERIATKAVELAIEVTLQVELLADSLDFSFTLKNKEECVITDFEYPRIGIIKTLAGGKPALLSPKQSGQIVSNVGEYLSKLHDNREIFSNSIAYLYPGGDLTVGTECSMQWLSLIEGNQCLFISGRDDKFYITTMRAQGSSTDRGAISLCFGKMPFVKQGQSWQSPSVVLQLYTGSWHKGATLYREWAATWQDEHEVPGWIQDMQGYFLVINKQQFGHEMWDYRQLPALYELAEQHGFDTLGLFGWYDSGHDNQYPDLKISESMGGKKVFEESIKKVQEMGGRVTLYQQGHLIDVTSDFYKNGGDRYESRTKGNNPYYEYYNKAHKSNFLGHFTRKLFSTSCPSCPEWRDLMEDKTEFTSTFGPDGVLFDQIGGMAPYPCFNEEHPHPENNPSLSMSTGRRQLLKQIQTKTKEINPDYAFFTEHTTDAYASYADCIHGLGFNLPPEGAFGQLATNPEKAAVVNYPPLFRYCFPAVCVTTRNPAPNVSRRQANFSFVFGLRLEMEIRYQKDCDDLLSDTFAEDRKYSKKLTDFRKNYWDLLGATFVDDELLDNANPMIVSRTFVKSNQLAVALWNDTSERQVIALQIQGYTLVEYATMETKQTTLANSLEAQEIAVAIYEKR